MDAPPVGRLFCPKHSRVADVRTGEALKASKRETHPKMRPPPAQAGKAAGRSPVGEAARAQRVTAAAKPCSRPLSSPRPPPRSDDLAVPPTSLFTPGSCPGGILVVWARSSHPFPSRTRSCKAAAPTIVARNPRRNNRSSPGYPPLPFIGSTIRWGTPLSPWASLILLWAASPAPPEGAVSDTSHKERIQEQFGGSADRYVTSTGHATG